MSDPALVAGDRRAWDEVIGRHRRALELYVLSRGLPLHIAEELANEAWARLFQKARQGRLQRIELPGLAFAEAGFVIADYLRSRERREVLENPPPDDETSSREERAQDPLWGAVPLRADEEMNKAETQRRVRAALRQLAPGQMEIAEMFYYRDMNANEIAEARGITPQRVREVLCTMRRRVAELLGRTS